MACNGCSLGNASRCNLALRRLSCLDVKVKGICKLVVRGHPQYSSGTSDTAELLAQQAFHALAMLQQVSTAPQPVSRVPTVELTQCPMLSMHRPCSRLTQKHSCRTPHSLQLPQSRRLGLAVKPGMASWQLPASRGLGQASPSRRGPRGLATTPTLPAKLARLRRSSGLHQARPSLQVPAARQALV